MEYKGLKVGVFTITDAINYGAFYQMFAMAKYLEANGADVTVYHCGNSIKRKLVKYFSYSPVRQVRKLKLLFSYGVDSSSVRISKYNYDKLDVAILGSDEIWNLQNSSFDRFEQYYGVGLNAAKIVAYAPSIGFARPEFLLQDEKFRCGLNGIDTILVRDRGTQEIAETITGRKVNQVVDPTILFDNWEDVGRDARSLGRDFVLYYGYSSDPPFRKVLIDFARSKGLRLVTAGHHAHDWCDTCYAASPFEFLQLLRDSTYVFTSTFHGTVMATLLNKKFCYYGSGQKVVDFGVKFGLEACHLDEKSTLSDVERALTVDTSVRREKIVSLRDESRAALRKSILN